MGDQQSEASQLEPDIGEVGRFGTTRQRDPSWMGQLHVTRTTSDWRQYYRDSCIAGGFPHHGVHLCLTGSFDPHSLDECSRIYTSIVEEQRASQDDSRVMIFAVSYDHEQGRMSPVSWRKIVSMLRQLNEPGVRAQLWVDKVDSANRTGEWGLDQLLPYVMFPVLRVGSQQSAGFWSNMEGLAGIYGRGLYHDNSLSPGVVQYSSPVVGKDFFASRAATFNPGDAVITFYIHLMFGTLSGFRNHHEDALRKLSIGAMVLALVASPSLWLELIVGHERNSLFDPGRFEIINGFTCRTDIPKWHGLREWITVDRWIHNVFAVDLPIFVINGFVNVYEGRVTKAVVHWVFPSSGWTRRLQVELSTGSREEGQAIFHLRLPGYRPAQDRDALAREEEWMRKHEQLSMVYRFDAKNIRW